MAMVKAKDLRQHSAPELREREKSLVKEFFDLTQKKALGQLDRPHRLRQIRREIAQIKTISQGLTS
jgi:large subunit ribosomal protein L29